MQAPKGGIEISGVFYKGGQFLPSDYEPKFGKYNRKSSKRVVKVQKVAIAWKEYVEAQDGKRSIYQWVAGTVARYNFQTKQLSYCGNVNTLDYAGLTETKAHELIEKWNNGERWI